jgi:hypothetical protein
VIPKFGAILFVEVFVATSINMNENQNISLISFNKKSNIAEPNNKFTN